MQKTNAFGLLVEPLSKKIAMRNIILLLLVIFMGCSNRSEIFVSKNGKAINGYDPVGYFEKEMPVKGLPEFQYHWRGATWNFASTENRQRFAANPELYAPQYGGYCAYGMSNGYKAPTDPEAWTIVGGKLYLNYNSDVRNEWFATKEERIVKANANWVGVRDDEFR
jgi:YHS domain-containing protein